MKNDVNNFLVSFKIPLNAKSKTSFRQAWEREKNKRLMNDEEKKVQYELLRRRKSLRLNK